MRILGVDPGSLLTGYGCVESSGSKLQHLTHGTLKLTQLLKPMVRPKLEDRLLCLHQELSKIIVEYNPSVLAVEDVFFAKNALSALTLGQARGVILLTAKIHSLKIFEYGATQVKKTVTGHGQADKHHVAKTIQLIFGRAFQFSTTDASDGLALALCHVYSLRSPLNPCSTQL